MIRISLALLIVSIFYLFEFLIRVEPSLASEAIQTHFKFNNSEFGIFASLFFIVYTPMQMVVGLLLDRFGAKRFIVLGAALCGLGIILLSTTPSIYLASVGRMLSGFGASFAFVGALYVVSHFFPAKWFTTLSGIVNMVGMLGTAVGMVWLGDLILTNGWEAIFRITGIICLVLAVLALFLVPHAPPHMAKKAKSLSIIQSIKIVSSNKHVWLLSFIGLFFYMPINVFGTLWGNEALRHLQGFSDLAATSAVSMIFLGMAFGSVLIGFLSSHLGERKWLMIISSILANVSFIVLILAPINGLSLLMTQCILFSGGVFCGAQMLTFAMAKDSSEIHIVGTVLAFVNMLGIGGAIVFQPFFGWLLDISNGNFKVALITIPASLLVTTILALISHDHYREKIKYEH